MKYRGGKDKIPEPTYIANEDISGEELQVISQDGENLGRLSRTAALQLAATAGLDLVLIANKGGDGVPVARVIDLGRMLYSKKKKLAKAKKHQKVIQIKEVKLRPKIGEHDYETKLAHGIKFLREGKRLKVTIMFAGREMATKEERGREMFARVETTLRNSGLDNLVIETLSRMGHTWSKLFYIK